MRQQKAWARLRGKNRIIVCRNTRKRLFLRCKVFLIHWILYQNDFYVLFVIDLKIHAIPDLTNEKSGKYNNKAVWNIKINICIHSIHHNCRLLAYNKKHGHEARKNANIFRVRVAKWGAQKETKIALKFYACGHHFHRFQTLCRSEPLMQNTPTYATAIAAAAAASISPQPTKQRFSLFFRLSAQDNHLMCFECCAVEASLNTQHSKSITV